MDPQYREAQVPEVSPVLPARLGPEREMLEPLAACPHDDHTRVSCSQH